MNPLIPPIISSRLQFLRRLTFISLSLQIIAILVFMTACSQQGDKPVQSSASEHTRHANKAVAKQLPLTDQQDFQQARKGLIAQNKALHVRHENGSTIWQPAQYDFIKGEAPDSVNPSLWRQASLNNIHGLFEVTPGIYQLRGFDLSNMTLIQGKTGWIVIDPLTAKETAKAAFDFAMQHLPQQPVSAVLFTHSHIDHFGGVLGLLDKETLSANKIPIIAPAGFMEEATSENIIAGTAMSRRAGFMYGRELEKSITGHVGSGLGKSPAFGTFGIAEPNLLISKTGEQQNIDGVPFIFQYTPESEAPAEMTFYLPQHKAFCGAELVSRNMHNLYTLRGAKVRDARKWSAYIDQAREMFADSEIYFASHHWPIWGQEKIQQFLTQQRDSYKFIHDQTVRFLNAGMTPGEIAERIRLPASLANNFSNRGYYGTVKHNSRAVYQGYMGWYDGNPAHLDPLPKSESAARYVTLAGGAQAMLQQAQASFDQGDYRWTAELLNHLVFAQSGSSAEQQNARELLANSYDQLGFQAESGPWRDVYLSAAQELRHGKTKTGIDTAIMKEVLLQTPVSNFFDALSVRLKAEDAEDKNWRIRINFSDLQESYYLWLENSVLHHRPLRPSDNADASLTLTHELFVRMLIGRAGIKDTLFSDDLEIDGSTLDLVRFFTLFEQPDATFAIVTAE